MRPNYLTIHISSGLNSLKAAKKVSGKIKIVGVSTLTSLNNKDLKELGYGIIIYDAYRPWFVTKMFWEGTPENLKHFVANPENGSSHNKGCAIDIGLYDIETGESVIMISGYDEFTERAYPNYLGGSKRQRDIRDMLIKVMEKNDFTVYEYEWWHFNYNKCNSGIMNYSFSELDSINSI